MLNNWLNFFIATFANCVTWMDNQEFLGVPLIGFIVATFIGGVILRAFLYKA